MNKLPPVYYQIKKLKLFWEKSSSSQKEVFIRAFEESLLEIELNVLIEEMEFV